MKLSVPISFWVLPTGFPSTRGIRGSGCTKRGRRAAARSTSAVAWIRPLWVCLERDSGATSTPFRVGWSVPGGLPLHYRVEEREPDVQAFAESDHRAPPLSGRPRPVSIIGRHPARAGVFSRIPPPVSSAPISPRASDRRSRPTPAVRVVTETSCGAAARSRQSAAEGDGRSKSDGRRTGSEDVHQCLLVVAWNVQGARSRPGTTRTPRLHQGVAQRCPQFRGAAVRTTFPRSRR